LQSLGRLWRSYRQRRRQRLLDDIAETVRQLQREEEAEVGNVVDYAARLLGIKPFSYQARLLMDESKRIVACMGRQTGKTTTIAVKAIHYADRNPNVTVLITSPCLRQSMIMFDRILSFIYQTARLRNKILRATRTLIHLDNGSRIIALPCSENLLRGYSAHMIICDETSFVPERIITQIMFPMLAATDGHAVFLSTPWSRDHFFYRAFMDPSYSVHKVRSSECPLIKPEFLTEMRSNMTREAYLMEYEAGFAEASNCYFRQDLIRGCVESAQKLGLELYTGLETPFEAGDYYAGVDFGKLRDHSVIAVVKREAGAVRLVYMYQFQLETPYTQVIGHIVRASQRLGLRRVMVDQTGLGEPVLEEIHNQGVDCAQGLKLTTQVKEDLLAALKISMEQNLLAIPYDRRLCEQINEQRYEYGKSGHLLFSHPENSHDDMLWALALALHASQTAPPPGTGAVMLPH
jgi:phage FluMu gp28-like protein